MKYAARIIVLSLSFGFISQVYAQDVIDVYLIGGQSNALGRADIASDDPLLINPLSNDGIADNNILYHHNYRGSTTLADDGFLVLGSRPADDGQVGNFGMELTFGRDMQNANPDARIAILKYAVGGTNLINDWAADGTADSTNDGSVYQGFQNMVNEGITRLQQDSPDAQINIKGMLWQQGESDTDNGYNEVYEENLTTFIEDVRLTVGVDDLPFYIGGLSSLQTYLSDNPDRDLLAVINAQINVAAGDPDAYFISLEAADGMTIGDDNIHYDTNGYKVMGELFASQTISADIPEPITLLILSAGGATILFRRRK